ncbi:hypothetical protein VTI74DRAFT_2824 [Chaetomium olivicolor]
MRLLNAKSLELKDFPCDPPPYAILSHTWGDEEVTYQEINSAERETKKGFAKILGCCRQALADTLEWVWIDTCCIDKTSSAELSEAINSMYAWYRDAQICYAFLEDVPPRNPAFPLREFRAARWFTRGWCLQELIAPYAVEFYASDWSEIGTRFGLCHEIEEITTIPQRVLRERKLDTCSVAQRMSWASGRKTSRIEDEAYCLIGIFDVHMPMLYGEGQRAFFRLQEEILKQAEDYSFLLWAHAPPDAEDNFRRATRFPVFAPRPACFHKSGLPVADKEGERLDYRDLKPSPLIIPSPGPSQMTNRGLRVSLPSKSWSGALVIMWTGFLYQDALYFRAGNGYPAVLLLNCSENYQLADFFSTDLYLSTSNACQEDPYIGFMPNDLDRPDYYATMDIVLFSAAGSTITLIEKASKLSFRRFGDVSWPPSQCSQRTQTWRVGDRQELGIYRNKTTTNTLKFAIELWKDSPDIKLSVPETICVVTSLKSPPHQPTCRFTTDESDNKPYSSANLDSPTASYCRGVKSYVQSYNSFTMDEPFESYYSKVVFDQIVEPSGSDRAEYNLRHERMQNGFSKAPTNGTPQHRDELSANVLRSKDRTMQLLRRRTSSPLPKVFVFCDALDKSSAAVSEEKQERHRARVLENVASAMVQLREVHHQRVIHHRERQNCPHTGRCMSDTLRNIAT